MGLTIQFIKQDFIDGKDFPIMLSVGNNILDFLIIFLSRKSENIFDRQLLVENGKCSFKN